MAEPAARGLFAEPVFEGAGYSHRQEITWSHKYLSGGWGNSGPGILTTAGKLFTGDATNNLIAFDPATEENLVALSRRSDGRRNGLMTYMLDGKQYLLVGAGDFRFSHSKLVRNQGWQKLAGNSYSTAREITLASGLFI